MYSSMDVHVGMLALRISFRIKHLKKSIIINNVNYSKKGYHEQDLLSFVVSKW